MGRSRFPGKPLKFHNKKRISVLSGTVYHENAADNHAGSRSSTTNDFSGEKEVLRNYLSTPQRFSAFAIIIMYICLKTLFT